MSNLGSNGDTERLLPIIIDCNPFTMFYLLTVLFFLIFTLYTSIQYKTVFKYFRKHQICGNIIKEHILLSFRWPLCEPQTHQNIHFQTFSDVLMLKGQIQTHC